MKSSKIISFFFLFAILFFGCRKEAIEIHPEMEGHWRTEAVGPGGVVVEIEEGKQSSYFNSDVPEEINEKGKARIKGDKLKIGKEELTINEFPRYDMNGDYSMVVNGNTLIKSITPRVTNIDTFSDHVYIYLWFAGLSDQGFTNGYFHEHMQSLDLQYKLQSDLSWTTITNWTSQTINNLSPASTYEFRIKAYYPWGNSEFSQVQTFTTN
jgi:hypothetical protein